MLISFFFSDSLYSQLTPTKYWVLIAGAGQWSGLLPQGAQNKAAQSGIRRAWTIVLASVYRPTHVTWATPRGSLPI